jgi:hypothetical protein
MPASSNSRATTISCSWDIEALCAEIECFLLDVEARVAAGNVSGTLASPTGRATTIAP